MSVFHITFRHTAEFRERVERLKVEGIPEHVVQEVAERIRANLGMEIRSCLVAKYTPKYDTLTEAERVATEARAKGE